MNTNQITRVASMIGEPARTAMLVELMDGRSLTASELARAAGITAPTASSHLAQLVDANLLLVTPTGRHRYFRLASHEVARMLETIIQVASQGNARTRARIVVGPRDVALRKARICYDHLAGRLGVAIAQRLVADNGLILDEENGYLTDAGRRALVKLGIGLPDSSKSEHGTTAASCRPCMDWSERRFHLAGRLAAHICNHCLDQRWLQRRPESRVLDITPIGQAALQPWLGMDAWRSLTLPCHDARMSDKHAGN